MAMSNKEINNELNYIKMCGSDNAIRRCLERIYSKGWSKGFNDCDTFAELEKTKKEYAKKNNKQTDLITEGINIIPEIKELTK